MAPNFKIMLKQVLKLGILFLFLLGRVQGKEEDEKPAQKSTPPYLDSKGNLCQDRMELIQDTEYETMIQCRVAMIKSCEDNTIEDQTITKSEEACHTVYEKECKTVYRPHRSKVRVRICPNGKVNRARSPFSPINDLEDDQNDNSIVLDVRPNPRLTSPPQIKKQCHNGKRMVCTTKYHTECTTQQIQQTMEEDHPKCQVEMVEKCPEDSNRKKSASCTKVPAMRCRIEKRTVVKTKPESKCSRIPRQLCRKEDCDVLEVQDFDQVASESRRDELLNGDADCYYRNQVVNEIVPQEKCSLIPKTMCHTVNKTNDQSADASVNSSADLDQSAHSHSAFRRTKRSARDHWAFLRRHYLSRAESPLQRMSRNFEERQKSRNLADRQKSAVTSASAAAALKKRRLPPVVCKMVPEQKCEKKRVNPRRVEKQMKKTFCREPRNNSIFDQLLMAKLTNPEFSDFNP